MTNMSPFAMYNIVSNIIIIIYNSYNWLHMYNTTMTHCSVSDCMSDIITSGSCCFKATAATCYNVISIWWAHDTIVCPPYALRSIPTFCSAYLTFVINVNNTTMTHCSVSDCLSDIITSSSLLLLCMPTICLTLEDQFKLFVVLI